jgi:hypothetical protein
MQAGDATPEQRHARERDDAHDVISVARDDADSAQIVGAVSLREEAGQDALDEGVLQMQVHAIAANALQRLEDNRLERSGAPVALALVTAAGGTQAVEGAAPARWERR